MRRVIRSRVPRSAVSMALLMGSALWGIGFWEYYATSALQSDWSGTPLLWMLIIMVTPAICFATGLILFDARKYSRLSRLEWCALLVASCPVTLGTLLAAWAVKVLFSMSGLGV
jgi:hypothetical protein